MSRPLVHVERIARASHSTQQPPLVLLHGWGLNCRVFAAFATSLASQRDVFAADLPGHGASAFLPWDEYRAALLAALPAQFDLLGWSLGGQLALELAEQAPTRVRRLVLIATTPKFVASTDWPHGMRPEVLAHFATHLAQDYRRTVADFLELQVRGSQDAEATLATLRAALLAQGEAQPAALAAGLSWLRDTDLRDRCQRVLQPTLAISGQYDRVTPSAALRAMAASLPQARFVELRRAGHAPFLSHRAECVAAIEDWLTAVAT